MMSDQFYPFQPIQFMDGLLAPPIGAGAAALTRTYRGYFSDVANLISYTFSGIDVGTAPNTLVVVACFSGAATPRVLSSATINGVAASIGVNAGGNFVSANFAYAVTSPGGAITIQVTWSGACVRGAIGVWTLTGYESATPQASNAQQSGSDGVRSITMSYPAGGMGFYAAARSDTNAVFLDPPASEEFSEALEATNRYVGGTYDAASAGDVSVSARNPSVLSGIVFL